MFSKVTKKVIAIALVFSLAFAVAAVTPSAATTSNAAKKVKLNKKKASLSVGKSITLKANQKVKWSASNAKAVNFSKKSGKTTTVQALSAGKVTITAKAGSSKASCTLSISGAASGTVIYDLSKETGSDESNGESFAPPVVCKYEKWKYSNYAIWQCRAVFSDPANGGATDYRGKKLNCSITFKNSGKRDLPELYFAFNYTKGGGDGPYPAALHITEKKLDAKVKKDKMHKHATIKTAKIKKGKTYTYNFSFTIPKDAMNGDKDEATGLNYPIMFYLANLKDNCPYKKGDGITIMKCKWTVA